MVSGEGEEPPRLHGRGELCRGLCSGAVAEPAGYGQRL